MGRGPGHARDHLALAQSGHRAGGDHRHRLGADLFLARFITNRFLRRIVSWAAWVW